MADMELRSIELRTLLGDRDFDVDRWTLLLESDDGGLEAFGLLWAGRVLGMLARPSARGRAEPVLLDWAEAAAGSERLIVLSRGDDLLTRRLLAERGYTVGEEELRLERPLSAPLPDAPLPAGFRFRTLDAETEFEDWARLYREAIGPRERAVRKWRAYRADPDYLPDLDLVVADASDRIAAVCNCSVARLEAEHLEVKEGRTEPVMVRASDRGRGLGRAVVREGLRRLAASGLSVARLTTEADNLTAHRLYSSFGYREIYRALWYASSVDR